MIKKLLSNNVKEFTMLRQILLFVLITTKLAVGQYNLDYFTSRAIENSPLLKEYKNLQTVNQIQKKINSSQNSSFQVSLTGNYLFTPYFNNHGDLITTDPSPEAIGYDINIFDGGLYSAQLNVEQNLFNGKLMGALNSQVEIQDKYYQYQLILERHNLEKEITDQYLNTLQFLRLIQLSQEVATNLDEQLKLSRMMVEKGFTKTQDYLLLKIESKNLTVYTSEAKQLYRNSLFQLYNLCGIQDTTLVEIQPVKLSTFKAMPTSNFIKKYELDSLMTVNQQLLFETKYRPQLLAFFNTGVNAVEMQNIQQKFGMSAGLNLALSLYDGNQKHLTRQQNLINQKIINDYRLFFENNISLQRKNLESRIDSLQKNIDVLTEQIQDYQTLLEISAKQLEQGNISMIDHLVLWRNFINLRKNTIDLEVKYQLEINNYNYWNW